MEGSTYIITVLLCGHARQLHGMMQCQLKSKAMLHMIRPWCKYKSKGPKKSHELAISNSIKTMLW